MSSNSYDVVPLAIILSATSDSFNQKDAQGWYHRSGASYVGGSEWVKTLNPLTSLKCSFEGTSITFHGLNQTQQAWTVTAILDGQSTKQSTSTDVTNHMSYDFMTFSGLEEGSHTIDLKDMTTMSQGEQPKIDYAYAIPGQNTPLRGKLLMVDDTDPAVSYSGSWSTLRDQSQWPQTDNNVTLVPHGKTAHQSQTVGDSFEFSFVGTSVAVYGVNIDPLNRTGTVRMNFQLDDLPPQPTTIINSKYTYYQNETIPAAKHTLRMNITNVDGDVPVLLDYILYTAAFDSLASPGMSGSSPTSTPDRSHSSSKVSTEAIVGATVGAIVGFALCIIALLAFRFYRRRRGPNSEEPEQIGPKPGPIDLLGEPLPQRDGPGLPTTPTDVLSSHVTPFYDSALTTGISSRKQAIPDSPNLGRGCQLIQDDEVAPPAYDFDSDFSAMNSDTTTHR